MDQKRLLTAIALSLGIMLIFEYVQTKYFPHPVPPASQTNSQVQQQAGTPGTPETAGAPGAAQAAPPSGPRLLLDAPQVSGSIALTGAVFDDVVLKSYHETIDKNSPLVQLMGRRGGTKPSYAQFGWTAPNGVKVPDDNTLWTASAPSLTPQTPVTLSWDNGAGLTFELLLSVDDQYMFTVGQDRHQPCYRQRR